MKSKFRPPPPGGEVVQILEPFAPKVRAGVPVVKLVPIGDGGPAPLVPMRRRKKRRTLFPRNGEIQNLPRWARVAFLVRCARRVWPLCYGGSDEWKAVFLSQLERAIHDAEEASRNAIPIWPNAEVNGNIATQATWGDIANTDGPSHLAAEVVAAAIHAANPKCIRLWLPVGGIAGSLFSVTTDPRDLLCFRRDFDRLVKLAKKHNWTDDTPVPPEVFGPMWPKGRTPEWAKVADDSQARSES